MLYIPFTSRRGEVYECLMLERAPTRTHVLSYAEGAGSTNLPLILTDATVLDCPICAHPLSPPIFQCAEGHIACEACFLEMEDRLCYCCRKPFGHIRCRAVENILESIKTSCCYKPKGFPAKFSYDAKSAHEKACPYAT